jgi:tetratricopeptide (TPR) repeat protein
MTHNNLGNALRILGERDWATARLEEAVTAYRDALLGALQALGEGESGTARLEEAVTAYREALLERTRDSVPLDLATTQNNLGNALQALGARKNDRWAESQNHLDSATKLLNTTRETEADPSSAEAVHEEFSSMRGLFA